MRWMKWMGLAAAALLIVACFRPWVVIRSLTITVSGVEASGTNFGKPGYLHFILLLFFIPFSLLPKIWAKRFNLLVVALNLAWAFRNFVLISQCRAGECPEKQAGLYLMMLASVLMLVAALFPHMPGDHRNSTIASR